MGQRLLIVESDRRFIQEHQAALESSFAVDYLYGTEGALPQLEAGDYSAVLICAEASENKGYSLCSAIRKSEHLSDLKVALISAKATGEEYARHQSLKGRAADLYLHKPIAPGALVAALTRYVPLKEEDPDNPLGDLSSDLGEEWLDSLRTELDVEPVVRQPMALPPFLLPQVSVAPPPVPEVPRDAGRVELLESRVRDLEAKLVAKCDELDRTASSLEELRRDHASATRNLDDLEQRQAENQDLHQRLREAQETLSIMEADANLRDQDTAELRDRWAEAMAEQDRLRQEGEATHLALSEKVQQNMDFLESHQLLQAQLAEARELEAQARAGGPALAAAQTDLRDLEERLAESLNTRDSLELQLLEAQDALAGANEVVAKLAQVEEAQQAAQARIVQLEETHEAALARAAQLEEAQQAAQAQAAQLKEAQQTALAHAAQLEEAQQTALAAKDDLERQLQDSQEALAATTALLAQLEEEQQAALAAKATLEAANAELQSLAAAQTAEHEVLQQELMAGIDEREAALGRLNGLLEAQREHLATLELQRTETEGLLQASQTRWSAVTELLAELEGKATQALNLAKAAHN